jgi:cell wall-associated NlpC family hydrolase
MGLKVPPCRVWCGAFVHEAFLQAGIRLSPRLIDPNRSFGDAVAHRRGLRAIPVRSVRRGDLLFYRIRPGLRASHLAIVRDSPTKGYVHTVEGNTSNAVRLNVRGLDVPVLAARVVGPA